MNNLINWKQVQGFGFGAIVLLIGACDKAEIPSIGGGDSGSGGEVATSAAIEETKSPEALALEQKLIGSWRTACQVEFTEDGKKYFSSNVYEFGEGNTVLVKRYTFTKGKTKELRDACRNHVNANGPEIAEGNFTVANQVRSQPVYSEKLSDCGSNVETLWAKVSIKFGIGVETATKLSEFEFASIPSSPCQPDVFDGKLAIISEGSYELSSGAISLHGRHLLSPLK